MLCRNKFGLNIESGGAGGDPSRQDTCNLDVGGTGGGDGPTVPRGQRDALVADGKVDVGSGGELHDRGDQLQLIANAIDVRRGLFDSTQQLVRQHDARQLFTDAIEVALDLVDPGEPGAQPVRLLALGGSVEGAARSVGPALSGR